MSLRYLRTEEGLSQNEVTSILQDNEGFMWFGTRSGLNRYDGYEFLAFDQVPGDSCSLVNTSIERIYKDSKGIIWVGTKGSGLYYSLNKVDFCEVPFTALKNQDRFKLVRAIYEDREGNIWIGTSYNTGCLYL